MMPGVKRILVVGNSGSGKTHLAQTLSVRLGLPHLELDALNHRAGWQEAPVPEFREAVVERLREYERSHGGWVVDGNYRSRVADLLEPDIYVWLDYSRPVVFRRVLGRTLSRLLLRRTLWNGNRERWTNLVSRDPHRNIILWSWTQDDRYAAKYEEAAATATSATWIRLRHPREAESWLAKHERWERRSDGQGHHQLGSATCW